MLKKFTIRLVFLLGSVALAGCAIKKPLPESGAISYRSFAQDWVGAHACHKQGILDTETAAFGLYQLRSFVSSNFIFDQAKLDAEIASRNADEAGYTDEYCRKVLLAITSRKQQIAANRQAASAEQEAIQQMTNMINSAKSTNTYCNRVGAQVLCSSY